MNLAVIGLGKLGLPLAVLQAQNHSVVGIDVNQATVDKVNAGMSPLIEPGVPKLLSKAVKAGNLSATTDMQAVTGTDISLVIVPTPSKDDGRFSNRFVLEAVEGIGTAIKDQPGRHVVVICSTVMPGACAGPIAQTLQKFSGKNVGEDVGLLYSPEFIALGSVIEDMLNPAVAIVGESDSLSGDTYTNLIPEGVPIRRMSLESAEIAKISLNAYVTMKISFANTIGEICERVPNSDSHMVTDAIGNDPRVGSPYIRPGGPYGGPCFPRDNRAFAVMADEAGVPAPLALATDWVNYHQIKRTVDWVDKTGRKRVGLLGFTYKPGTPIFEESFGMLLAKQLVFEGYEVVVYDSMIKSKPEDVPDEVEWRMRPEACFGNEITTVIALPDPRFVKLFPNIFAHDERMNSVVIDCWGILPVSPWTETHVIRLGVGEICF